MVGKLTLELKKEFGNISEIVEYLKEMACDIDYGKLSNFPNWQIFLTDEEDTAA